MLKRGLNGKQEYHILCGQKASFGFLLSLNTLSTCHTQRPQKFVEGKKLLQQFIDTAFQHQNPQKCVQPTPCTGQHPYRISVSTSRASSPLRWLTEVQGEANRARALAGVQRCSGGKEGRRREVKNTRNCGCSFVSWLGIYIQNGHSQNRYSFCHVHSAHLPHPDRSATPQASLTTRCNSLMPLTITMFLQLSPFLSTRKRTDKYRFLSLNP